MTMRAALGAAILSLPQERKQQAWPQSTQQKRNAGMSANWLHGLRHHADQPDELRAMPVFEGQKLVARKQWRKEESGYAG